MDIRKRSWIVSVLAVTLVGLFLTVTTALAGETGKATGKLGTVTKKFKTFTLKTKKGPEIISFTDKTEIKNSKAKSVSKIPGNTALIVSYTVKDGKKVADVVTLKIAKVDPKDVIKTEEVAALVEQGPEKGNFLIIDSRPAMRYAEGHLPYAVSLPFHKWDKVKDGVLPKDKETLLVFYCGGPT
jgi:Rhodanese-like domain